MELLGGDSEMPWFPKSILRDVMPMLELGGDDVEHCTTLELLLEPLPFRLDFVAHDGRRYFVEYRHCSVLYRNVSRNEVVWYESEG